MKGVSHSIHATLKLVKKYQRQISVNSTRIHKLVKMGSKYIVSHTPILVLLPAAMLNKGAMQMAEVVEYLKPPDAACDALQLLDRG